MAEYGKCFSNLKRNAAISLAIKVGQIVILVIEHTSIWISHIVPRMNVTTLLTLQMEGTVKNMALLFSRIVLGHTRLASYNMFLPNIFLIDH